MRPAIWAGSRWFADLHPVSPSVCFDTATMGALKDRTNPLFRVYRSKCADARFKRRRSKKSVS